ncbi:hypothetical protein QBC35DRAFT_549398 [Podospora australis]|uniref:Uncharacterized protein n=1 Tax=Podospora australis TaxID=1536484 RepID=A0AAN6WVT2_9PEZI|nr:hypothetical protein QBC35DRAFT_549398 [Podospora australis]
MIVTNLKSSPNPVSISNGTCYSAPGLQAPDGFIPCGNAAFGDVNCCWVGAKCLGNNACYTDNYGTTYLAGCTDSSYSDGSCPDKGDYADQWWTGLITCGQNNDEWVRCKEDDNPDSLRKGDKCECPDSYTPAFEGTSRLEDVARLPATSGGVISWIGTHIPADRTLPAQTTTTTTTSSSSSLTTSSSPSTPSSMTSTFLTTTSPTFSTFSASTSPTSTVAAESVESAGKVVPIQDKIGIALGILCGICLIISIYFMFRLFRPKKTDNVPSDPLAETHDVDAQPPPVVSPIASFRAPTELSTDNKARPWSVRSELPDGSVVSSPNPATHHLGLVPENGVWQPGNPVASPPEQQHLSRSPTPSDIIGEYAGPDPEPSPYYPGRPVYQGPNRSGQTFRAAEMEG